MNILKQIKQVGEHKVFSWSESFSDKDGKSTIMPLVAGVESIVGAIVFIYAAFTKQMDLVSQSIVVMGIGATLFGIRKVMNGKPQLEDVPLDNNQINVSEKEDVPQEGEQETP